MIKRFLQHLLAFRKIFFEACIKVLSLKYENFKFYFSLQND